MANGLIFSHLHYCDTVLGQAAPTTLARLQAKQDQAIRIIYKLAPWSAVDSHRRKLGWLDLAGKRAVHLATLLHRCINKEAPVAIIEFFIPVKPQPRKLRQRANRFEIPKWKKERLRSTLSYRGAVAWNQLPDGIQSAKDAETCRQMMFELLLNR
jgi:hypothetical protein